MPSRRLPNYLRSNRKRSDLSQDEVAHLLGVHGGAKVCHYERFDQEPSLKVALAFEAVFQKPVRELFAGLYDEIEEEVVGRAKVLAYKVSRQEASNNNTQKLEAIKAIIQQLAKPE